METNTQSGAVTSAPITNDAAQIAKLGQQFNLVNLAAEHIGKGTSIAEFRKVLIDHQAANQDQTRILGHRVDVTRDERDGLVEAMAEGLACRYLGTQPSDRARAFQGARLGDLARRICEVNGLRPLSMNPAESIRLAHSTSDYPNLLQGTGNRLLLNAYQQAASPIKVIARQSTADDFRLKTLLRLGEMPELKKVPEGGEITQGTRSELKESYRLATFARLFSLTRQAQINDDLGAFSDYFAAFGQAAARLEGTELVALLAANGGLGANMDDATPLFTLLHNNLIGSGTVINVANLGLARKTMRLQTGIDGTTVLGIPPRFLVVPPDIETVAEQYLADLAAAESADTNPFSGKLMLVCVAELSAISITAWMLFADPNSYPVLEFSHLSSQPGPQIETRQGWEVLGAEFRCYMDYGCGIVGTRGTVLNPGA